MEQLQINVEDIMREIRRNVNMDDDLANMPTFQDIPLRVDEKALPEEPVRVSADMSGMEGSNADWDEMRENLLYINKNYTIQYYWNFAGGRIKVFFKRVIRKLAKCLLLPIVVKQTEFNAGLVRCVNNLYAAITESQPRMDANTNRIAVLESEIGELLKRIETEKEDYEAECQELWAKLESQNALMERWSGKLQSRFNAQGEERRIERGELLAQLEAWKEERIAEQGEFLAQLEAWKKEEREAEQRELLAQLEAWKEERKAEQEELLAQFEAWKEEREAEREDLLAQLEGYREESKIARQELLEQVDTQNKVMEEQRQTNWQHVEDQTRQLRGEREEDIRFVRRECAERITDLRRLYDEQKARVDFLDRQSDDFSSAVAKALVSAGRTDASSTIQRNNEDERKEAQEENSNIYKVLDYFKFQNEFRGTRSTIAERQKMYLPYFQESKEPVLDIGCGRGEFLQLMKKNRIEAYGIDLYPEYVVEGALNGVDIRQGDGIAYLQETDECFGGIFVGQVIEHISFNQLETLCRCAYEKLQTGKWLVLESPNPMCLSTFATSFYMDPTHERPVHPLTLSYLLREIGFSDVQIIYTNCSRQEPLPMIESEAISNLEQVNKGILRVSELLYGSLDYAVVAKK